MDPVNNNKFEIKLDTKSKRKITTPSPNVYLNPALDLLANEDPMCNNIMEVVPSKKRKNITSCDITTFENNALDLGISKAAVSEFLARELDNVRKSVKSYNDVMNCNTQKNSHDEASFSKPVVQDHNTDVGDKEPIYANLVDPLKSNNHLSFNESTNPFISSNQIDLIEDSNIDMDPRVSNTEQKFVNTDTDEQINVNLSSINNVMNIQNNVSNQIFVNNLSTTNLSFIDRLALDSPNVSNQSLYYDDDLNESNIMEIKTITIITKRKKIQDTVDVTKTTNPFLEPSVVTINNTLPCKNPFINSDNTNMEVKYSEEILNRSFPNQAGRSVETLIPRKLFDTNSTVSTENESILNIESHEYENIDSFRSESPIYENINEDSIDSFNKQSKILGYDVSKFSKTEIMNMNRVNKEENLVNSHENKKDLKNSLIKASNKLSKKVLKKIKRTFKSEKPELNFTLNPYEVPRKPPKVKNVPNESGIENPGLNLNNSDELENEDIEGVEHEYETVKTLRNTHLNMNITPLKERVNDVADISQNKTNTPGKKVRFDASLNKEKIITGDSFDYSIQSPGFDSKIEKYHDELENCINEKKFLQQNM